MFCILEVFPLQLEGVRLVVNKGLSNHFQVSHTITLSTLGESGYRFGSTYVGSKQTGPAEVVIEFLNQSFFGILVLFRLIYRDCSSMYSFPFFCHAQSFPVMVGDMDNTGSLNAQVIHQLTSAVRSKIAIQVCREQPNIYLQSITNVIAACNFFSALFWP